MCGTILPQSHVANIYRSASLVVAAFDAYFIIVILKHFYIIFNLLSEGIPITMEQHGAKRKILLHILTLLQKVKLSSRNTSRRPFITHSITSESIAEPTANYHESNRQEQEGAAASTGESATVDAPAAYQSECSRCSERGEGKVWY